MKKPIRINSEYGPLELEIVHCDNGECTSRGIEEYLVNWLEVSSMGVQAAVMSDFLGVEDRHFCSTTCLKKVLG